jgi:hypothetical protein
MRRERLREQSFPLDVTGGLSARCFFFHFNGLPSSMKSY